MEHVQVQEHEQSVATLPSSLLPSSSVAVVVPEQSMDKPPPLEVTGKRHLNDEVVTFDSDPISCTLPKKHRKGSSPCSSLGCSEVDFMNEEVKTPPSRRHMKRCSSHEFDNSFPLASSSSEYVCMDTNAGL